MSQSERVAEVKRLWGRFLHLLSIVMLVAASCVSFWLGLNQAGVVGTHGTFTVRECHLVTHHTTSGKHGGSTSHSYTCSGTFRPTDNKIAIDDNSSMSDFEKAYPKGHQFSTQRTGASVMLNSPREAMTKFLIGFACLLADAFVLFWFITRLDKNGKTLKETWRSTKGTATRPTVITIAAVALVGMALSPVLAFTLSG
ncbi:hypothetical protein [Streptomyces sp. NPDC053427]|uniref:hypothetical protein n=1 Tax=Streptomyces sp. NPDC053427 TaxID=3365701 RepID=UPI0037D31211